jgi:hypothetical protein
MTGKRRLTRAELRLQRAAERAAVPEARAYDVEVSDASAQCWVSQIVFFAASRKEAEERLKAARFDRGGGSLQSEMALAEIPPQVRELAAKNPEHFFRSRLDDGGWTCWEQLLPVYRHPTDARAARDPSVWGPAGEARPTARS